MEFPYNLHDFWQILTLLCSSLALGFVIPPTFTPTPNFNEPPGCKPTVKVQLTGKLPWCAPMVRKAAPNGQPLPYSVLETASAITVTALAQGGTPPYTYEWLGGINDFNSGSVQPPPPTASPNRQYYTRPGKYWVQVTDANGQSAICDFTIEQDRDKPKIEIQIRHRCVSSPDGNIPGRVYIKAQNLYWSGTPGPGQPIIPFNPIEIRNLTTNLIIVSLPNIPRDLYDGVYRFPDYNSWNSITLPGPAAEQERVFLLPVGTYQLEISDIDGCRQRLVFRICNKCDGNRPAFADNYNEHIEHDCNCC